MSSEGHQVWTAQEKRKTYSNLLNIKFKAKDVVTEVKLQNKLFGVPSRNNKALTVTHVAKHKILKDLSLIYEDI